MPVLGATEQDDAEEGREVAARNIRGRRSAE